MAGTIKPHRRKLVARQLALAVLMLLPSLLYWVLAAERSWRPREIYNLQDTATALRFIDHDRALALVTLSLQPTPCYRVSKLGLLGNVQQQQQFPLPDLPDGDDPFTTLTADARAMLVSSSCTPQGFCTIQKHDPTGHGLVTSIVYDHDRTDMQSVEARLTIAADGKTIISDLLGEYYYTVINEDQPQIWWRDSRVDILDGTTLRKRCTLPPTLPGSNGRPVAVTCVAVTPDGKTVATGGNDSHVRFYDAKIGRLWLDIATGADALDYLAISRDGRRMISIAPGHNTPGHIRGVDLQSLHQVTNIPLPDKFNNGIYAATPAGSMVVAGKERELAIFDLRVGRLLRRVQLNYWLDDPFAISEDGTQLAMVTTTLAGPDEKSPGQPEHFVSVCRLR